jgi:hypothetical protein
MTHKKLRRFLISYVDQKACMQKFFILLTSLVISLNVFAFDIKPELFQLSSVSANESRIKPLTDFLSAFGKPFKALQVSDLWSERIRKVKGSESLGVAESKVDGDKISAKDTKSYTEERPCDGKKSLADILWHTFYLWLWPIGPICLVAGVIATIIGNFILLYFTQR